MGIGNSLEYSVAQLQGGSMQTMGGLMQQTSSISQDPHGMDSTLAVLAALGLEEHVVEVAPTDAETGWAAIEAVSAAAVVADLPDGRFTAMPAAKSVAPIVVEQGGGDLPSISIEAAFAEVAASAPSADLLAIEWQRTAEWAAPVLIPSHAESLLPASAVTESRAEGLSFVPSAAGESSASEAASAAKRGPGGGGGGGGGGGDGVSADYFSGKDDGQAGYDIWIKFKGSGWTEALQQPFKNAADYFTTVIIDDIGGGGRIGKVIVDDLYVTAEVKAIDGPGGILGQAGPTHVWTVSELTAAGQMQFDVADALTYLDLDLWDDIVTHEFMHVLGFGSLWNYGSDPLVVGEQYLGSLAVAAYDAATAGTQSYVPVETDGGSGTAGAHWDETTLGNELMTGYINTGGNYLSKFSVMSLADLGYRVDYFDYPHDSVQIA